ncbi:DUF3558 family protein [Mycobacteroides abscessus]|uniref:DUF3558 family protein n=1 Tax=Mycobacteroides abscessus TaxID=36809 RepID=UPI00092B4360|nr:DUF3558 family protein [Mycobacteroides abscessus]SHQ55674.1 Protein of uncharacterised function (DUF3558) [Mycobacteroides abscessus subsp. abscessus]SHQ55809.1 Protein of uncharacterised function (DUF3558) [Mycobacteroides abscessus subsp. abscessus]SHQ96183.1 Protein of uncharacterised function (DUF3558) [Mycobacteroides abscessus subsp. abscessus]SHR08853.1 Protein of uncharacterised function (DUF3558) [Mycobacteroides abscessus subsp. abscessus]SHR11044.1 Protein of uncharacterised fun
MMTRILGAVASALALAACGGTVAGTPATEATPESTSASPTALAGVSPPTTAAPNTRVTATTFDGCASVTDAEAKSWELDPASKQDAKDTLFSQNVRGCRWTGPKWFLKVGAVDGALSQWDTPREENDRQERIMIGSRSGWLLHNKNQATCAIALPSQQGIATIQVDLKSELTKQRFDQCPLAVQIATTIEPRIP